MWNKSAAEIALTRAPVFSRAECPARVSTHTIVDSSSRKNNSRKPEPKIGADGSDIWRPVNRKSWRYSRQNADSYSNHVVDNVYDNMSVCRVHSN